MNHTAPCSSFHHSFHLWNLSVNLTSGSGRVTGGQREKEEVWKIPPFFLSDSAGGEPLQEGDLGVKKITTPYFPSDSAAVEPPGEGDLGVTVTPSSFPSNSAAYYMILLWFLNCVCTYIEVYWVFVFGDQPERFLTSHCALWTIYYWEESWGLCLKALNVSFIEFCVTTYFLLSVE